MELILLEKVANLGNLGDKVKVKAGTSCCHSARPPLPTPPTWLRSKSVAPSWKKQLLTVNRRLKAALPNWPSWK
jgi:hypothetical protein